jgi:hypothetical protein
MMVKAGPKDLPYQAFESTRAQQSRARSGSPGSRSDPRKRKTMRPPHARTFLLILLVSLAEVALGDVFVFKDGTCLEGKVRMRTQDNVFVRLADGKNRNIPQPTLERIIEGNDACCPETRPDTPGQQDRRTDENSTEGQADKGAEADADGLSPVDGTEPPEQTRPAQGVPTKDSRVEKFIGGLGQKHASAKKAIQKAIEQAKARHKVELTRAQSAPEVREAKLRLECIRDAIATLKGTLPAGVVKVHTMESIEVIYFAPQSKLEYIVKHFMRPPFPEGFDVVVHKDLDGARQLLRRDVEIDPKSGVKTVTNEYRITLQFGKVHPIEAPRVRIEVSAATSEKVLADAVMVVSVAEGRDRQQKELERLEAVAKLPKKTKALTDQASRAVREAAQRRPESVDSEMQKWEQAVDDSVQETLKALKDAENPSPGVSAP